MAYLITKKTLEEWTQRTGRGTQNELPAYLVFSHDDKQNNFRVEPLKRWLSRQTGTNPNQVVPNLSPVSSPQTYPIRDNDEKEGG